MSLIRWEPQKDTDELLRRLGAIDFARWPHLSATRGDNAIEWSPASDISAETKDGVLNVHIPKLRVEKSKPVQIKVE